jgi:uncharacterized protein with NAD-binding domain and iron-sulfur cluster
MNECSASAAIDLFQRAFLPSRNAATIGVPTVSLRELIGDPAQRYLTTQGGEVRVGVGLQSLQLTDGRVSQATLTDNATVDVQSVTLAVPAQQMAPLLPESVRDSMPSLPMWRDDKGSPIICIHLWFKEPVTSLPHAILRHGLPQWFFAHPVSAEVTEATGATQRLVAVISAADAAMDLSNDEIVSQTMETLQLALPQSRGTLPIFSRVVREPKATFTLTIQTEHHRVLQGTNIPNLHLAGDWTDSGWPATLEGAVASAQRIAF